MIRSLLCAVLLSGVVSPLWAGDESPADKAASPESVARPSEYWLGVECQRVNDLTRRHFHLAEESAGLVVLRVWASSPAGEAGIEPGDIIVEAGGKPVDEVRDLIQEVEAVKQNPIALLIQREGEKKTVEVTPAKRPAPNEAAAEAETQRAMKWLERFRREMGEPGLPGEGHTFRWQAIGPGVILRHDKFVRRNLPDDVTVSVQKSGDKPAEVTVKRGDQTWTTTEDALDTLPDDVRPLAEVMLGHGLMPLFDGPRPAPQIDRRPLLDSGIEKRLDEMNRRLEKLDRAIQELRQPKPSAKEPAEGPVIEGARDPQP